MLIQTMVSPELKAWLERDAKGTDSTVSAVVRAKLMQLMNDEIEAAEMMDREYNEAYGPK